MQANLPDDPLVRETMASLGPGAKDSTLDELAAWIRQLEELSKSQDAALAPPSFRTDINGSCLSKFPASGTTAQRTELQTKAVKGYPPLPELRMEKVSSQKKNARGEAKLRLSVEDGPVLVLLTITDLNGATRTLRVVTVDDNDLIPIKHPATTIEATAVPFSPKQLLERLRSVEAKVKPQREKNLQTSASPQRAMEEGSAQRQAKGVKYVTKTFHGRVFEYIFDREKGMTTMKTNGCANPHCDRGNCTATATVNRKTGKTSYTTNCEEMNVFAADVMKGYQENPRRQVDLCRRITTVLKEELAIEEKLPTAKPAEKKRLTKQLENKDAEYEKLNDLICRTAETGGWLGVPSEKVRVLLEKAGQKDPKRVADLARRALAAFDEYSVIREKLESTSNHTKKKRLAKLLSRKGIEHDEAINEIAVIADGLDQKDSKEVNDVSTRMNESLVQ